MIKLFEHYFICLLKFIENPIKIFITLVSLGISFGLFIKLKSSLHAKFKILFVYAHLTALFFPLMFFIITMNCGANCDVSFTAMLLYSIPLSILFANIFALIILPFIFMRAGIRVNSGEVLDFIKKCCKSFEIKPPNVYIFNSNKPVAFSFASFKSAIFFSDKLYKLLSKKEFEAVLLHELAHIKFRSSLYKISAFMLRFSPFAFFKNFGREIGIEERKADDFVIKVQKTDRYILSAKRKIEKYG